MNIFRRKKKNIMEEFPEQTVKDLEHFNEMLEKLERGEVTTEYFEKELDKLMSRQEEFNKRLKKGEKK